MDNKFIFLDALYYEKKDQFGFDESKFMKCSYSDVKNKKFKDMSASDFHNLVIEMVDSKMIQADLKSNGEMIDGIVSVLRNGMEYYANNVIKDNF